MTLASLTYRNPKTLEQTGLRAFTTSKGQFVVVHEVACDAPNVYRHSSVEAARETWKRVAGVIKAQGFVEAGK